jgi:Amt family ammonium transporter
MRRKFWHAAPLALGALLLVPSVASATALIPEPEIDQSINTLWVIVAAVLVMFMQAGFAFLEIGFSRAKNAGTGIAKILTNYSIAALCYWAVGFAFAFGAGTEIIGLNGFFLDISMDPAQAMTQIPLLEIAPISPAALMFFQFTFCAVSLAIVWGTTLERLKFGAYIVYAVIFSAVIYPVLSHWIFGGGFLATGFNGALPGMQDFAGSTVVHLIGAMGALAALLHLGPRIGKYGPDGKPRAIPGHSMPLVGLGILILWLGWFGFNPGSALGIGGDRFAYVALVTNLAAAAGVVGASLTTYLKGRTLDIGMVGNGAIAGLVGITAPSGYVEVIWAPVIGLVAGVIVVFGVLLFERLKLDDPVGALSAHGLAGIWGTIACGLFTSAELAEFNGVGQAGLFEGGGVMQLVAQVVGVTIAGAVVFAVSWVVFGAIKATIGLRVAAEEEEAGLDIVEHGMYGYPEQFIPPSEYGAASSGPKSVAGGGVPVTAMTSNEVTA